MLLRPVLYIKDIFPVRFEIGCNISSDLITGIITRLGRSQLASHWLWPHILGADDVPATAELLHMHPFGLELLQNNLLAAGCDISLDHHSSRAARDYLY